MLLGSFSSDVAPNLETEGGKRQAGSTPKLNSSWPGRTGQQQTGSSTSKPRVLSDPAGVGHRQAARYPHVQPASKGASEGNSNVLAAKASQPGAVNRHAPGKP